MQIDHSADQLTDWGLLFVFSDAPLLAGAAVLAAAAVVQAGSPAPQTFGIGWSQSTLTAVSATLTASCDVVPAFSHLWPLFPLQQNETEFFRHTLAAEGDVGAMHHLWITSDPNCQSASDAVTCSRLRQIGAYSRFHLLVFCRRGHFHLALLRRWREECRVLLSLPPWPQVRDSTTSPLPVATTQYFGSGQAEASDPVCLRDSTILQRESHSEKEHLGHGSH